MAVVVNTNIGGRKLLDTQGMKVVQAELTVQAADLPTTGMPIDATLLTKLGLKSLVAVISATKRTAAGGINSSALVYDPVAKLLYNVVALSNTTIAGTAAVNGDIVTLTVLGY